MSERPSTHGERDPDEQPPRSAIDTSVPSPALAYDHWLGGTNNYEVDRALLPVVQAVMPEAVLLAVENRKWLIRPLPREVNDADNLIYGAVGHKGMKL